MRRHLAEFARAFVIGGLLKLGLPELPFYQFLSLCAFMGAFTATVEMLLEIPE